MATGKWTQVGVPHKGWFNVGIEDVGQAHETCEMCEAVEIRFVHLMRHPDYPDDLRVGCICAEHMETDRQAARSRERWKRNEAQRRANWLKRTWRVSQRGNEYLNAFNVTVFQRPDGAAASCTSPPAPNAGRAQPRALAAARPLKRNEAQRRANNSSVSPRFLSADGSNLSFGFSLAPVTA